MNLSTLTIWASQFCNDSQQTRYAGQYTLALNEAQTQFALDTRALFKDYAFSVVANQSTYPLPADFMFEKKVTITSNQGQSQGASADVDLTPISRAGLEFYTKDHDWTLDIGTPLYYMIDPEAARQDILLYPQPQDADAGVNNAILTYYPVPVAMVNPTDNPLNSYGLLVQFHIAIACYAAWLLLAAETASPEMTQKRKDLWDQYQQKVDDAINRFGNTTSEPLRWKGGRLWL